MTKFRGERQRRCPVVGVRSVSAQTQSCAATDHGGEDPKHDERRIDWAAVEHDYLSGCYSLRELAERHPCARSSIANRARKGGWTRDAAETAHASMAPVDHIGLFASLARGSNGRLEADTPDCDRVTCPESYP